MLLFLIIKYLLIWCCTLPSFYTLCSEGEVWGPAWWTCYCFSSSNIYKNSVFWPFPSHVQRARCELRVLMKIMLLYHQISNDVPFLRSVPSVLKERCEDPHWRHFTVSNHQISVIICCSSQAVFWGRGVRGRGEVVFTQRGGGEWPPHICTGLRILMILLNKLNYQLLSLFDSS